jgi:hypothetical protein
MSKQKGAVASQNSTKPRVTGVPAAKTDAVSVTTVPELTDVAGVAPLVTVRLVWVTDCACAKHGKAAPAARRHCIRVVDANLQGATRMLRKPGNAIRRNNTRKRLESASIDDPRN